MCRFGEILNLMSELQETHGFIYLVIGHNLPVVRHQRSFSDHVSWAIGGIRRLRRDLFPAGTSLHTGWSVGFLS